MLMVVRQNGGNSREDQARSMRKQERISERAGEILDLADRTLVTIPNTSPHGKVLAGIVQKSVLQILDGSYR